MRIATWNCNGGFRNKFAAAVDLNADILVVQECEDPARSNSKSYRDWACNHLWLGEDRNRGLGVFAKAGFRLAIAHLDSSNLELFLPCWINESTLLLAVWTKRGDSQARPYIGQLWNYIQAHRSVLAGNQSIVIGDLNSNVCWDKPSRTWNHSDVVRELEAIGLKSAYHHARDVAQGLEQDPTFYLQRKLDKAYHIDYSFVPANWLAEAEL